jgi:hypothetical protein
MANGVMVHMLDGQLKNTDVESRLNAILRTPPSREAYEMVSLILRSRKLNLKKCKLLASFMVVDGTSVCYETINYDSPDQFALAISHYDDPYLAKRFISFYHKLEKDAMIPQLLLADAR